MADAFPGRRPSPAPARAIILVLGLLAACQDVPLTIVRPDLHPVFRSNAVPCGADCLLAETSQPFAAARANADSIDFPVALGGATITGIAGESVSLVMLAEVALVDSLLDGTVDVSVTTRGGASRTERVALAALATGATVHHFAAGTADVPDTVRIAYALPRVFGNVGPRQPLRLVQRLSAGASVLEWSAPWARHASMALASLADNAGVSTCTIGAPGAACGVTVGISPYATASVWGAFQSGPGTGQSAPITITFSSAVSSVTITAEDPTFGGNSMTAYNATGDVLGSAGFPGSGTPGINIPSTQTISAAGIRSVVLTPAARDFVAYDAIVFTTNTTEPTLAASCPASVVRGEAVSCKIRLSDASLPFTITGLSAGVTSSAGVSSISFTPPGPQAAGAVYDLAGPAVGSTHLTVEGTTQYQGRTLTLSTEADFAVLQRAREQGDYVMELATAAVGPGHTSRYPSIGDGASTLGLYHPTSPDWNDAQVATAPSGPNKGMSYVLTVPGLPAAQINLTFALFPGDPWYAEHARRGGELNSLGQRICPATSIDALRLDVERHEGITMVSNSHYGIDQGMYRRWHLAAILGGLVSNTGGAGAKQELALTMQAEWSREQSAASPLQQAFDATDTPQIFARLGCSIYLD